MIHQPLSPDGVHPQISSTLRFLVLCLVRPDLFVINYCLFIFSKNSFLSLAPLIDKCHTSIFNGLIMCLECLLKVLWEKKKLLISSNFSFSQSVFFPFGEFSAIFIKFEIVVCKLFQLGRV